MLRGVTANAIASEIIRVAAIHAGDTREHVGSMIIHRRQWSMRSSGRVKFERTRRIGHTFIRVNLNPLRMVDSDQLKAISKECFLQLVLHATSVTTMALLQWIAANANVLHWVGRVVPAGFFQVAHLAATHEIRDELKSRSVPRVEIRTRRRLAIEFSNGERCQGG